MKSPYYKTDNFDIKVGMIVYTAAGQKVGEVLDVAGFGSQHVVDGWQDSESRHTTQASHGTGHFGVRRSGETPEGSTDVRYKFTDIDKVVENQGVVLIESVTTQAERQAHHSLEPIGSGVRRPRWPSWLRRAQSGATG